MKILITGATGFVGGHLTETLVNAGYEIKALVRKTSDTSLLENLDIEIVRGDITNVSSVERAVRGCHHIYHLAAKTSQVRLSKTEFYAVNVEGTENVARAAMKANVERLVYVSTAGIYGTIKHPPVDENTKPNPNSLYRESKLLSEKAILSYYKKEALPVVIARIGNVLGPRSFNWLGLFQAISKKRFRIIGAGDNHSQIGYISDIVGGIRRCAETKGIEGESYLIAGKEPIRVKWLVDMISRELGIDCPRGRLPAGPFRVFNYLAQVTGRYLNVEFPYSLRYELFVSDNVLNITKSQKELKYFPVVSMREGIRRTANWYREMGYI